MWKNIQVKLKATIWMNFWKFGVTGHAEGLSRVQTSLLYLDHPTTKKPLHIVVSLVLKIVHFPFVYAALGQLPCELKGF